MPKIDWAEAFEAFTAEYGALGRLITSLGTDELRTPSGCRGWSNADLIFHLLLDAQRALVTFNSPVEGPSDRDFISYWKGFQASDESSQAHARFVRTSAGADSDPKKLCARWHETARAATRCAETTTDIPFVSTQGHVLPTSDFIATLVVEATIHHLDLLANIDQDHAPEPAARSITRWTLEGMLGQGGPTTWDDITLILKTTGRRSLSKQDQVVLGEAAKRLPLFS